MVETTVTTDDESKQKASPTTDETPPRRQIHHREATYHLKNWHAALDTSGSEKEKGKNLANRGDRALLRRCRSIDEVLLTPVYFSVRDRLEDRNIFIGNNRALACVVGLLANIKTNDEGQPFGRQLATKRKDADNAKLSGLRFRRLLQIDDRDALYVKMIGVLRLLDGTANIPSFIKDLYYWKPSTNSDVRKRWAEGYYSAAPREL